MLNLKAWYLLQGLIGKLSVGDLPIVKASGPFGCPQGPKWAAHRVLVIFAGGIGVCIPDGVYLMVHGSLETCHQQTAFDSLINAHCADTCSHWAGL